MIDALTHLVKPLIINRCHCANLIYGTSLAAMFAVVVDAFAGLYLGRSKSGYIHCLTVGIGHDSRARHGVLEGASA